MRKLAFGLVALVFVGLGWSALWSYAAGEAEARFAGWMADEHARGRDWTCPQRRAGGYPFALTIRCTEPRFSAVSGDRAVRAGVAALEVEAALLHPTRVDIALSAPLTYKTTDGSVALAATWSKLNATLEGVPDVSRVAMRGTDIDVSGAFPDGDRQSGAAAQFDASFAPGPDPATLAFAIAIQNATVPPLDDLLGTPAPVALALSGQLDHADAAAGPTPDAAIEAWRQAGGRMTLASSRLSHADASLSAQGGVTLDATHRPQGRLQAQFVGLEPVLKRYGIGGHFAAAGSLINSLFGSKAPNPEPQVAGALNLPISFNEGYLGIGPIRTPIQLPPLY